MSNEMDHERTFAEVHGDTIADVIGEVSDKLVSGAYDVLQNHHEDVLVVTSGGHQYEHRLTRHEAEQLERAVWSAGEDQTLITMLKHIKDGLSQAGFTLAGDQIDITVRLREVPLES